MPHGKMLAQGMLFVDGGSVRTHHVSVAEGARLIGLPAAYRMPWAYTAGFRIRGDGVAVPVVRHLARHLLELLVAASRRPRTDVVLGLTPAWTTLSPVKATAEITDVRSKDVGALRVPRLERHFTCCPLRASG